MPIRFVSLKCTYLVTAKWARSVRNLKAREGLLKLTDINEWSCPIPITETGNGFKKPRHCFQDTIVQAHLKKLQVSCK
jgi:hypothetical protein